MNVGKKYISCEPCAKKLAGKSKTLSFKEICKELTTIYGNQYTYKELEHNPYKTKKSKILVICKDHIESPFERSVEKLKAGQKCSKCTFIESYKQGKFPGGYSDIFFKNNPNRKNDIAYLYFVKIDNFYKIGITINVDQRLKSLKSVFNKIIPEIIEVYQTSLYNAYIIEQKILNENKEARIYKKQSTELFSFNILENQTLKDYSF